MLRFYSRFPKLKTFKNPTDEKNWYTADKVLSSLSMENKNIIMEVYRRGDTLPDNIYRVAKELKVEQDMIWTLVSKVTKRIAKERGLI